MESDSFYKDFMVTLVRRLSGVSCMYGENMVSQISRIVRLEIVWGHCGE